jgi:hypothetical protein
MLAVNFTLAPNSTWESDDPLDSFSTGDFTVVDSKYSCIREFYDVHIVFA